MSNRKIVFILLIFLAVITVIRLFWLNLFSIPNQPYAVQGTLDVRGWESITDHSFSLDGEWDFFPNILLMDTDFSTNKEKQLIQVPGNWNFSNDSASTYGFGSYRLRILVDPDQGKTYGLYIPNISSSSEVYINGELLIQSGKPAEVKQYYDPLNVPHKAYFTIDEASEIELIIHVANYDDPLSGGIVRSVKFGLVEPFNKDTNFATNIVVVACIIYMFHALYGVILFLAGNFKRRLLYFSLMIVCIVLGTLIGERLLFAWIPFTYDWSVKVTYFSMIAGGYFLFQVIRMNLPEVLRIKSFTLYSTICGLLVLLVLFAPTSFTMSMNLFFSAIMLIPCLLVILVMYRATVKIDKDNIFLLLAGVAAIGSLIWLIIIGINQIEIVSYPFDLIIATICFSTYWFKQYFQILHNSQQMTTKLQEEDKRKDEFLVNVAHEMRNPLHGILNISQAVLEREKRFLREQSIQDLELLKSVGRHMQLLLNDLLDLSRVKENRMLIKPTDVSIQSVIETVFEMLRYMTDGGKIHLIHRIPKNFPLVLADENRLIQILFNLLHNAIKYSNAEEVSVHASIKGRWAKISVTDTGIGMDNEFLNKVFEPYERATSSQTLSSGLGIGLSVCKQLVEIHGGTLEVTSKLNEGSVFTFTLKLASSDNHSESVFTSKPERNREQSTIVKVTEKDHMLDNKNVISQPIRILAVDDDPVNLKVLKSIFSMEPYEIITVTSGKEALSMIDKENWDLIISDVVMPQMSGFKLIARIRKKYSILELPVLFLTAYNRDEDIEAGFRVGANDYVVKPMNTVEIRSRVASLVNLKRSVNERLRMEAAWLQAQIKPHFIINTFNAIVSLSRIDLDRMDKLIHELSNYIRLSIDFQNCEGLTILENELGLVQSYLFILKERFGDRIKIIWEVDDHARFDLYLPPLTIQPLVENAIVHGILNRCEGGELYIRVKENDEFVEISIEDNGEGIDEATVKQLLDGKGNRRSGIGLRNTDRRLKQIFGKGLQIETKSGKGTIVSFAVPKVASRHIVTK